MKKTIAILTLSLLMATASQAQIYVTGDETTLRDEIETPAIWPNNPYSHDQGNDDYVPVGNGLLLLAALGGAYLLGKRNNGNGKRNK